MTCIDCNAAPAYGDSRQCRDCFDARYVPALGGVDSLGTWDLGWITVEMVMVGQTFDRDGTPVPVCLIDVPGLGMTRLRGQAVEYWEVAIVDLLG